MAASQAVIEKIQKLFALAGNNPNEHEAAAAAAKAQDLLRQYDLEMADVDTTTDPRLAGISESDRVSLRQRGKPGSWKVSLYRVVAQTSDCWPFGGDTSYMVGRKQDVEVATYLYEYLVREVERLQDEFGKTRWAELRDYARDNDVSTHYAEQVFSARGRHPLKAKNDWLKGAVPAVIQVLRWHKSERDTRSDADKALVISKESALRDWYAKQRGYASWDEMQAKYADLRTKVAPLTKRQERAAKARAEREYQTHARRQEREYQRMDWDAYEAGQAAGRKVSIREGIR